MATSLTYCRQFYAMRPTRRCRSSGCLTRQLFLRESLRLSRSRFATTAGGYRNIWSTITFRFPHYVLLRQCFLLAVLACSLASRWWMTARKLTRRPSSVRKPKSSHQSMKPTAPLRHDFSVFATTPWISSRCPATLVRFASSRSHTPAVMLFNASRGLSPSR
jgi:hypothetical protein